MRRIEHGVIAVLAAALAALSWVHWFRGGPVGEGPPGVAPKAEEAREETVAGGAPPSEPVGKAGMPAPATLGESEDERRARVYAEERRAEVAGAEQARFDALLDQARALIASGGLDALLWAPFPLQTGSGNDRDLMRLVAEFEGETDPARLWALAQRIRFHLTDPRGTLWTTDPAATVAMERMTREDADPLKRALALGSGGGGVARNRLLHDLDARVQAKAAGILPAPSGVKEGDAGPVADRYRELLGNPDAQVRTEAARGFGRWAFRDADVDALIEIARTDPSPGVRAAAAQSLGAGSSDRARKALSAIAADPTQPESVRAAARGQLEGAGVLPEGLLRD